MGHRSARGCRVAAGDVPRQGGDPQRLWHVLRSRRAVQLLLARLCHWHRDGRSVRRQPAASVCERLELHHRRRSSSTTTSSRPAAAANSGGNLENPYGSAAADAHRRRAIPRRRTSAATCPKIPRRPYREQPGLGSILLRNQQWGAAGFPGHLRPPQQASLHL